jgi:adenosylmethionine-8-amino-7-oxononanoate aminotransferase
MVAPPYVVTEAQLEVIVTTLAEAVRQTAPM